MKYLSHFVFSNPFSEHTYTSKYPLGQKNQLEAALFCQIEERH